MKHGKILFALPNESTRFKRNERTRNLMTWKVKTRNRAKAMAMIGAKAIRRVKARFVAQPKASQINHANSKSTRRRDISRV